MDEPAAWVKEISERQSSLVQEVMELEKEWPEAKEAGGSEGFGLEKREKVERLLRELEEFAREIAAVFLAAPVSALYSAKFAWASYEIANARLNLVYLLLFGVNAHHREIKPMPKWQGPYGD